MNKWGDGTFLLGLYFHREPQGHPDLRSGTCLKSEEGIKTKDKNKFPRRFTFTGRKTSPKIPIPLPPLLLQLGMSGWHDNLTGLIPLPQHFFNGHSHSRCSGQKPWCCPQLSYPQHLVHQPYLLSPTSESNTSTYLPPPLHHTGQTHHPQPCAGGKPCCTALRSLLSVYFHITTTSTSLLKAVSVHVPSLLKLCKVSHPPQSKIYRLCYVPYMIQLPLSLWP